MQSRMRLIGILSCLVAAAACCVVGCAPRNAPRPLGAGATLEVRLVSLTSVPHAQEAIDPRSGKTVWLTSRPVITATDIATVQRSDAPSPSLALLFNLTPAGAKKLAAATTPPTGKSLAVIANGRVISIAPLHAPITGGFEISGGPIQHERDLIFDGLTRE